MLPTRHQIPFAFDAEETRAVNDLIVERHYPPGKIIFVEGEASPGVWWIQRGRIRLFKTAASGRELVMCLARANDRLCRGTCPLFDDSANPVSAQALDETTLWVIPTEDAIAQTKENPALARALGVVIANRYRHLARLVSNLSLRCIPARLADLLLEHAETRGHATPRGIELDLDVSQETLAALIGTDRAVIARALLAFERQGILDARGRHILITAPQKLVRCIEKV